jgi:hypothetical protein
VNVFAPSVIVSPTGMAPIATCRASPGSELVSPAEMTGMGTEYPCSPVFWFSVNWMLSNTPP